MKTKITKIIIAAAVICVLTITAPEKPKVPAYTVHQTVEALKDVRNLHVIRCDESGDIEDERWIEINADGTQGNYFQETAGRYLVAEDAATRLIYLIEKNVILLYDRDDTSITWISGFNSLFEDMAGDQSVTIEDIEHNGQKLHLVQWSKRDVRCCIDPETKLPIVVGYDEIYYEQLPEHIFDKLQIPETAVIVDKRKVDKDADIPGWTHVFCLHQKLKP